MTRSGPPVRLHLLSITSEAAETRERHGMVQGHAMDLQRRRADICAHATFWGARRNRSNGVCYPLSAFTLPGELRNVLLCCLRCSYRLKGSPEGVDGFSALLRASLKRVSGGPQLLADFEM